MINAIDNNILIGVADDSASCVAADLEHPHYKKLLAHPKIIVTPHIARNTDYKSRKSNDMIIVVALKPLSVNFSLASFRFLIEKVLN